MKRERGEQRDRERETERETETERDRERNRDRDRERQRQRETENVTLPARTACYLFNKTVLWFKQQNYSSILVYPTPLDAFQPVAGSNVSRSRDVCDGAAAAAVGHVSSDFTNPLLSHVGNGQAVRSGQRCPAVTGRNQ